MSEENEKALRETYGEKGGKDGGRGTSEREAKLSEALLSSLIDDDHNHGGNNSSSNISSGGNGHTGMGMHTATTHH